MCWQALCESGPYSTPAEETWQHYRRLLLMAPIDRTYSLNRFESIAQLESGTTLEKDAVQRVEKRDDPLGESPNLGTSLTAVCQDAHIP